MTDLYLGTVLSSLRQAASRAELNALAVASRLFGSRLWRLEPRLSPRGQRAVLIVASVAALVCMTGGAVWWRLASGPLSMDMVTPWMISALEERFGGKYKIEVGGTVLERDDDGRTAVRLRDIMMRDSSGTVVATAPKAEVGISASGLLTGHIRAERLSLIGAQMALRIEPDGAVTVFAGSTKSDALAAETKPGIGMGKAPEAVVATEVVPQTIAGAISATQPPNLLATLVAWLQTLDDGGLDGRDLSEIGLKNGGITVDDRRTGRKLSFGNINLGLTRLDRGGVALAVTSMGTDGPWSLNATVTSRQDNGRSVEAVVRDISPKDILLALRLDDGLVQADVPLSGLVRAEFAADGKLNAMQGRMLAGAGYIGDVLDKEARVLIDEAQVELHWDAATRSFNVPIEIHAGANRIALFARVSAPPEVGGTWAVAVPRGMVMLASSERGQDPPLVLDQISMRATYDPLKRRFELGQADLRGAVGGVALSGALDCSGAESRLTLGIAGSRMPVSAFKRIWPAVVAPTLRAWVEQHFISGTVERIEIAANTPLPAIFPTGPPLPPDALAIDVRVRDAAIRPVDGLPLVKGVDVETRVAGRATTVSFGSSRLELPSGGVLNVGAGTFVVPDFGDNPTGRAKLDIGGPVESAAELLSMPPLREVADLPFDMTASKGAISARLALELPLVKPLPEGAVKYNVEADVSGFSAERFIRGQKAEAAGLHVSAGSDLLQIKGDMRVAGTPASIDYRQMRNEPDAELRVQTTLDDAARTRLGLDFDGKLAGPVQVKMNGRVKLSDRENRLAIEADLTQARVTELLPGWTKPAGRQARASFVLVDRGQTMKLEDFTLDGSGATVRGTVVLAGGEIQQANLPTFAVSDGDKASLKAERGSDNVLKATLRGDVYDGRGLIKSAVSGQKPDGTSQHSRDLDLDIKLGAITGYHGEAVRNFELRMSKRGGNIRSFALSGGVGSNARLAGEMRSRGNGRRVIYIETSDAGALFRFTDMYPRVFGGTMSIAVEPPTADNAPQEGLLNIRDFAVRGEPALDRVASGVSEDQRGGGRSGSNGVAFSRMRVEFTRTLGRFAVRDGVVWGPSIGATMDGMLDFTRDEVRLRGTFVPAYGLNNMFSRLPIVGMFLGGGANEGLVGITYQVVGAPRAPVLQVNPMSAIAPGFLRKLFEFRGSDDHSVRAAEPTR